MQTRYCMRAKTGHYIESMDKQELVNIRRDIPLFKYARINHAIQAWDDVVQVGTVYPPEIESRAEFRRFNHNLAHWLKKSVIAKE